jgi:hypothetical protein
VTNLGVEISMKSLSVTSDETTSSESDDDDGLSVGVIIAIVAAILLLIALVGFAVYKHKQSQKGEPSKVNEMDKFWPKTSDEVTGL